MLRYYSTKIDQAPSLRLNRLQKTNITALSATKIHIIFFTRTKKAYEIIIRLRKYLLAYYFFSRSLRF